MPRTKAIEEIAGLMKGLRSARQQSPFFTMVIRDEWLVSFDYAIVIHSIHSMLKNSIHSIQKLMNGPTTEHVHSILSIVARLYPTSLPRPISIELFGHVQPDN